MDHYTWVAIAAMLVVTAVTTPIVGKLSDLYGRRGFHRRPRRLHGRLDRGLFAQSFAMLIVGRAIQGFGMGTLMPLSQTIIGDLIPARQRGKYQGIMGSVFGLLGARPIAGGFITDRWGWRALLRSPSRRPRRPLLHRPQPPPAAPSAATPRSTSPGSSC